MSVLASILNTAITVAASPLYIDYTSPDPLYYTVRKTDTESRFYITVVYSSKTGILMCQSKNEQNPAICSDVISIPLTQGTQHNVVMGSYRKLAIPGMYSLYVRCSLPGVNVKLSYEP